MRTIPPRLIPLPTFFDRRGQLRVLDSPDLPFPIRRVFLVSGGHGGETRGGHGHYRSEQLLVAAQGLVKVTLNPSLAPQTVILEPDGPALLIPAGNWAQQTYMTNDSLLLVLASTPYDPSDYYELEAEVSVERDPAPNVSKQ